MNAVVTRFSVIVPVYRSESTLPALVERLEGVAARLGGEMEAVFVVDGSPDCSYLVLKELLAAASFPAELVCLSRNFGSFAAIRQGLAVAAGPYFGVVAADLQEPPELLLEFFRLLSGGEADVTVGVRTGRKDPFFSALSARVFWSAYRRFIQPEVPRGGVDVFGCNLVVRDALIRLEESNSSLVGLLFWLGFRRAEVPYERQERPDGMSGWTFRRKVKYLLDSAFAFTDLPISALLAVGIGGIMVSVVVALLVLVAKVLGDIPVPGYTPTVLLIVFSTSVTLFGLGIVGSYVWRTFENSKARPLYVPLSRDTFRRAPEE
jgi:glycosyltransferase involved in cell wall biosynthesis